MLLEHEPGLAVFDELPVPPVMASNDRHCAHHLLQQSDPQTLMPACRNSDIGDLCKFRYVIPETLKENNVLQSKAVGEVFALFLELAPAQEDDLEIGNCRAKFLRS